MLCVRHSSLVKPLEPSSWAAGLGRPEHLDAGRGEAVGHAGDQRRVGPDHHEIDLQRAGRAPPGRGYPRPRRRCSRPPRRCRHCRARSTALCTGGRRKSPSRAHVRGRRRPPPGFACRGFDHSLRAVIQAARLAPTMDNLDPPVRRPSNVPEFSVSELSFALKRQLEGAFPRVRVRGEISQPVVPALGPLLFPPQGRERRARRRVLEDHAAAPRHQDRGRHGGDRHRQDHHLCRLLALPDHHRPPGAGGRRRAAEAAGGPAQEARRPRACSIPTASGRCPSCPR